MGKIIFKKPIVVCIGGPPSSGKDEQGKLLVDFLSNNNPNLNCYDNGEGLRNTAKNSEYTEYMRGILCKSMNADGKTVPGSITISGLTDFIFRTNDGISQYVLKGVFRTPREPEMFVEFSNDYLPKCPRYFVRLNVRDHTIWRRLCVPRFGRDDDADNETIKKRIKTYREQTNPIYEKIKNNPDYIFFDIDGEESIQKVHEEIKSRIVATESFRADKDVFKGKSPFCPS